MTEVQGKTAKENLSRYVLCVVVLSDQDENIDQATIREKVKFVTDIGTKIKPIVEAVESFEGSRMGVLTRTGPIEVEMQDQAAKFKIATKSGTMGLVLTTGWVTSEASAPRHSERQTPALWGSVPDRTSRPCAPRHDAAARLVAFRLRIEAQAAGQASTSFLDISQASRSDLRPRLSLTGLRGRGKV
jgi:hypothetical protein